MIFTDTVTWYHHEDGEWSRTVLNNVMWKEKQSIVIDSNNSLAVNSYVSVTVPYNGIDYQFGTDNLDLLVLGECQEEVYEQTFREVADRGVTIKSVADNTNRDELQHWRLVAQ